MSVVTSVVASSATSERAAWRWVAASALTFCAAALLLPFLGPSTVRDGFGLVPDYLLLHEIETVQLFKLAVPREGACDAG